jgi:4-cresol dehydrogenase (hydroxylating)
MMLTYRGQEQDALALSFEAILGRERVCFDGVTREQYARTTGLQCVKPAGIVYPQTTQDVVDIIRVANRLKVALHPISCGKNWGYGDACGTSEGQVIVDFKRMNAICELNIERAYVVVEPGVTQGQLAEYLAHVKSGLWMDATGAGPNASLIGNILERGFGHTRYSDHLHACCGLEVVLADGSVLHTGFGHFENAKAHRVYKYGIGPVLDGLFSQSNFGIVTRAGIYLMPEPEEFCAFFLRAERDADLDHLITFLSSLRLHAILQGAVHIGNDLRVISGTTSYPWERAGGRVPLPDDIRAELRRQYGVGVWNVAGSITGLRELVAPVRKLIRRELHRFHPVFITNRSIPAMRRLQALLRFAGAAKRLQTRIDLASALFDTLRGTPSTGALRGAWWRVRNIKDPKALDPLENDAGLIWVSPVLPADAAHARRVLAILSPIYSKYGFDTLVTFTLLTERAIVCVSNISFDRTHADERQRARECHAELLTSLLEEGYVPYRGGPATFEHVVKDSSTFWQVLSRIKYALDPNGIISPGRYVPPPIRDHPLMSTQGSSVAI